MLDIALKSAIEEKLQGMLDRIAELPDDIAQELTDWQVQDMHRKYPETTHGGGGPAVTTIFPRSRTNTPRRRAIRTKTGSKGTIARGKRPILRAVLIEILQARMKALGERTLTWR